VTGRCLETGQQDQRPLVTEIQDAFQRGADGEQLAVQAVGRAGAVRDQVLAAGYHQCGQAVSALGCAKEGQFLV
jgi:hypothetical protein